ncbi:MAG: sulfite exporter TauE/SafE family protein, partial [Deltaproteobacteria bacterium]|nr:sulfite exporter TauE/SafE family protein [Deltaproteobacteria bacterium]
VFYDALKSSSGDGQEKTSSIAKRLQAINLPPMIHFKRANLTISLWFTVPVGLATGMLAATIAVGGFIGVPGMIYVVGVSSIIASATELVIAFVMGLAGSINWAMHGMVDIRLVLIILGGSLFGVQLGAIGTTYVKESMIKIVMSVLMLMVAVSRLFALPKYLVELKVLSYEPSTVLLLDRVSFVTMCLALLTGAAIILVSMWKGRKPAAVSLEQSFSNA